MTVLRERVPPFAEEPAWRFWDEPDEEDLNDRR